jgi:hypothetical protein
MTDVDGDMRKDDPVIREKLKNLILQTDQQKEALKEAQGKIGLLKGFDKTEERKMPEDILELINKLKRNSNDIGVAIQSINSLL